MRDARKAALARGLVGQHERKRLALIRTELDALSKAGWLWLFHWIHLLDLLEKVLGAPPRALLLAW